MKGVDFRKINAQKKVCNIELYDKVAEEVGISPHVVQAIVQSQADLMEEAIKGGGLESITMVYLGKFKVNDRQVQKLMANNAFKAKVKK